MEVVLAEVASHVDVGASIDDVLHHTLDGEARDEDERR